jgi:membrane protease YdiL (CAAX protease family)
VNGSESTLETVSTSSEPSKPFPQLSFFRLAVTGEAGLLLLAWGLGRWLDVSPLAVIGPVGSGVLWGVAAALPLLIALYWTLRTPIASIRRLVALVDEQIGPLLVPLSLFELGILALMAGFSEEILFRGVLQVGLGRWLSPAAALIATSVCFGLVHFASRTYALVAGVMGCYLGILFLLADSLVAPIVSHGLYDFAALVLLARRARR